MRLLLALLLIALPATAQVRGVASVGIGDNSGLGYTSPSFSSGLGVEYSAPHFRAELGADYSPNRKDSEASGYSYGGGANVYTALGAFLVGGGAHWSRTIAPEWTKDSWRWDVAGGLDVPVADNRLRFLVSHLEPIDDPSNHLKGERYSLRLDVPSGKVVFRPAVEVGMYRFHASGNPDVRYSRRTWAVSLGIAR